MEGWDDHELLLKKLDSERDTVLFWNAVASTFQLKIFKNTEAHLGGLLGRLGIEIHNDVIYLLQQLGHIGIAPSTSPAKVFFNRLSSVQLFEVYPQVGDT